ncbi:unnamed protein product, partial [Amoebophrya sp. A25]
QIREFAASRKKRVLQAAGGHVSRFYFYLIRWRSVLQTMSLTLACFTAPAYWSSFFTFCFVAALCLVAALLRTWGNFAAVLEEWRSSKQHKYCSILFAELGAKTQTGRFAIDGFPALSGLCDQADYVCEWFADYVEYHLLRHLVWLFDRVFYAQDGRQWLQLRVRTILTVDVPELIEWIWEFYVKLDGFAQEPEDAFFQYLEGARSWPPPQDFPGSWTQPDWRPADLVDAMESSTTTGKAKQEGSSSTSSSRNGGQQEPRSSSSVSVPGTVSGGPLSKKDNPSLQTYLKQLLKSVIRELLGRRKRHWENRPEAPRFAFWQKLPGQAYPIRKNKVYEKWKWNWLTHRSRVRFFLGSTRCLCILLLLNFVVGVFVSAWTNVVKLVLTMVFSAAQAESEMNHDENLFIPEDHDYLNPDGVSGTTSTQNNTKNIATVLNSWLRFLLLNQVVELAFFVWIVAGCWRKVSAPLAATRLVKRCLKRCGFRPTSLLRLVPSIQKKKNKGAKNADLFKKLFPLHFPLRFMRSAIVVGTVLFVWRGWGLWTGIVRPLLRAFVTCGTSVTIFDFGLFLTKALCGYPFEATLVWLSANVVRGLIFERIQYRYYLESSSVERLRNVDCLQGLEDIESASSTTTSSDHGHTTARDISLSDSVIQKDKDLADRRREALKQVLEEKKGELLAKIEESSVKRLDPAKRGASVSTRPKQANGRGAAGGASNDRNMNTMRGSNSNSSSSFKKPVRKEVISESRREELETVQELARSIRRTDTDAEFVRRRRKAAYAFLTNRRELLKDVVERGVNVTRTPTDEATSAMGSSIETDKATSSPQSGSGKDCPSSSQLAAFAMTKLSRRRRIPLSWQHVRSKARSQRLLAKSKKRLIAEWQDPSSRRIKMGRTPRRARAYKSWSYSKNDPDIEFAKARLVAPKMIYPWKQASWLRQPRRLRTMPSRLLWSCSSQREAGRQRYKLRNY